MPCLTTAMDGNWLEDLAKAQDENHEEQAHARRNIDREERLFESLKGEFWEALETDIREKVAAYNRLVKKAPKIKIIAAEKEGFGLVLASGGNRLNVSLRDFDRSLHCDAGSSPPRYKVKPNLSDMRLELRRATLGGAVYPQEIPLEEFSKAAIGRLLNGEEDL